jgi:hypothetical protein
MKQLIRKALASDSLQDASSNPYIRALEESVELSVKLDGPCSQYVRSLDSWQREELLQKACRRVKIEVVEGFVAGYQ